MNVDELMAYQQQFSEASLRIMVLTYALGLYSMPFVVDDQQFLVLSPQGRELAAFLFEKSAEYRNYALEKVDSVRKRMNGHEDYVN